MKSVFANIGTFIPGLNLKLKKGKLEEKNFGMLCSEKELTLSENHNGIIELEASSELGLSISDIMDLNDPIIEIEITPNRGDCLGVRGIARDLAAAGIGNLRDLDIIFMKVNLIVLLIGTLIWMKMKNIFVLKFMGDHLLI